ncbi:MAG: DUF5041 domain-containing protein [Acetatifactor sp.]|nr:DUF5041 domain-containing protein [Acetatifactor sp.]
MKKTFIIALLALAALAGQAQEIRTIEPTLNDYLPLLKAQGYMVYSFDTKDFNGAQAEPVVMEYVKGEEPKDVLGFSFSMNFSEKLVIGFAPSGNDSTAIYTFNFSEGRGFNGRLNLTAIYAPQEPTKRRYSYESRPFELVSPFEKEKFIPLVLYGSYWYEPETSVSRFCGESIIKPDLSSDIVKNIPHFYVLGIKIK